MKKRVAGIDIGTNTILMLIAEYKNKKVTKIIENFSVARLGEDLDKSGIIKNEAIDRAKLILAENYQICQSNGVEKILAVGTSALRDAQNSPFVIQSLNESINSEINIISGIEEARLSFLGTVSSDKTSLVIDIGGGSTELIIGKSDKIIDRVSLQMGAVRMTERFFNRCHPPVYNNILEAMDELTNMLSANKLNAEFENVFAVSGTATTLATTALGLADYEVERSNGYIFSSDEISRLFDLYLTTSIDSLTHHYRIHPRRADLILAGALILKAIVEFYSIKEVIVSSRGLRYGILNNYFKKYAKT